MINVALDARVTTRTSAGTAAYIAALVQWLPKVAPDLRIHLLSAGNGLDWAEQVGMPRAIADCSADLAHYTQLAVPVIRTTPYVMTVHDLIHLECAQFFRRRTAAYYRYVAGPALRGANVLVMGDERTAQACEQYLKIPRERTRIVPLGYDPDILREDGALPMLERPFFFYAGNHRPHKNLSLLCAAWAALPEALEMDLLMTGPADPVAESTFRRKRGVLRFLGEISSAELVRYYRAATAYVHPAFREGFGIPMLEALVLGTPVLASSDALPTILTGMAQTFSPHDRLALCALLSDVATNPQPYRQQAREARQRVRQYTWERFALATATVYREVANESRP
jgi:glycosyltransferase involved in cell wall biosynthesis